MMASRKTRREVGFMVAATSTSGETSPVLRHTVIASRQLATVSPLTVIVVALLMMLRDSMPTSVYLTWVN
jgi:hypothetical protein